jgi:hypothetical protein
MNHRLGQLAVVLLLLGLCGSVSAQSCRDDIVATAPDSRFSDNGDGTVSDTGTGLMWKQCAEGLSGAGCTSGSAATFTWQGALRRAADTDYAGQTDWRLPNKNELESLVERRCYNPAINVAYLPNTPSAPFWSSSPSVSHADRAWSVYFSNGYVTFYPKGYAFYVRLVRAGQ